MTRRGLHHLQDAALTALTLLEFPHPLRDGLVARLTPAPEVTTVRVPARHRELRGDLYRAREGGPRGGLILVHGLTEAGKDDPRIVWLGRLLARLRLPPPAPGLPGPPAPPGRRAARGADVGSGGD